MKTRSLFGSQNIQIWLATGWLVYTSAMVLWWWRLGLSEVTDPTKYKMLMGEGIFFLGATVVGGASLIYFVVRDHARHLQLKNFFNIFSHDLKTSISRLRLQADVLKEDQFTGKNKILERIVDDINRLDLQLENSLIFSEGDRSHFMIEEITLSKIIESLKNEWLEIEVSLDQDAQIRGDRRSLMSVLRNIFQNAMIHGKSQRISIRSQALPSGKIRLSICDHGKGYSGDAGALGVDPLVQRNGGGNGIGLYLCRSLVMRQGGGMSFGNDPNNGFVAHLELPGSIVR